MIQAIETRYKDYRFRSRLEARWAVFFDALGVKWEYEKEGFAFDDGTAYLPDFWLPEHKIWIEIKGQDPTEEERQKLRNLHTGTKQKAVFFVGPVGECYVERVHTSDGNWSWKGFLIGIEDLPDDAYLNLLSGIANGDQPELRLACPICKSKQIQSTQEPSGPSDTWIICPNRHESWIRFDAGQAVISIIDVFERLYNPFFLMSDGDEAKYQAAIAAARSARFEHGEQG